jgi:hypothetical protein
MQLLNGGSMASTEFPDAVTSASPGASAEIHPALRELVQRLLRHPAINGLMVTGSTVTGVADAESDVDLVATVSGDLQGIDHISAQIEEIPVDIIVLGTGEIERFTAAPRSSSYWSGGGLPRWLQEGKIISDKSTAIARARAAAIQCRPLEPLATIVHNTRFAARYDLSQAKRLLASQNPERRLAGELRLMHALSRIFHYYHVARRLPWRGVREAIHAINRSDPSFVEAVSNCIDTPDRSEKLTKYEAVLDRALDTIQTSYREPPNVLLQFKNQADENLTLAAMSWIQLIIGGNENGFYGRR